MSPVIARLWMEKIDKIQGQERRAEGGLWCGLLLQFVVVVFIKQILPTRIDKNQKVSRIRNAVLVSKEGRQERKVN